MKTFPQWKFVVVMSLMFLPDWFTSVLSDVYISCSVRLRHAAAPRFHAELE
jgi:hypothetical protein